MSYIDNVGNAYWTPSVRSPYSNVPTPQAPGQRISDPLGRERGNPDRTLSRAVFESSFRIARTRAIRAQILNSTYETPERIEKTVERLLDVIG